MGRGISSAIVVTLAIGISMAGSTTAWDQESVGATCPGPRENYISNGDPDTRFAQTFVSTQSGNLTRAEIDFFEPPSRSGGYLVEIRTVDGAAKPTDTVLAATTVPEVPEGASTLVATFATPAQVTAGETYALVLSRPADPVADAIRWGYKTDTSACPGAFYYQSNTNPWIAFGTDQLFTVFVTPPPAPEPEPEAGAGDTDPPNTTLTAQPKAKTKKKGATFGFTSSEAGSSFECSLNGAPFTSCSSPHSVIAKKGKNSFAVRAKDPSGNLDQTPATYDWKVKKKKKK